jgi:hypothetical protein
MGDLALQFSTSFDDILSEISLTRTYAEQEQIYKGFIRLIQMQRKLLVARKELATKLKDSVDKPILIIKNNNDVKQPELTQDTQNQLNKASELPMPQPQLPKTISTAEEEEEEKIKSKPRIKMVTKKDSDIEVIHDEELPAMSSSSSSNAATESPSTEIPSTEIYSTKREGKEGTTIEKRELANEKRSGRNKSN